MANTDSDDKAKKADSAKNIFDDTFFDALNEIDDGLDNISFQKIGSENHDTIQDVLSDKTILTEQKPKDVKLSAKALPVAKLPQPKVKETEDMNKTKVDPLDLPGDDPASTQMREIWESMNTPDASEFKLMVLRLEPTVIKGQKISGYLETFHLPTTIPDIIEQIGAKYGGGRYQIRIVDGAGKYVKSKSFEISGLPKLPSPEIKEAAPVAPVSIVAEPQEKEKEEKPEEKKKVTTSDDDDDDDDDDDWDSDDYEFDPTPKRRLRPVGRNFPYNPPASYQPQFNSSPYAEAPYMRPSPLRREEPKDNKEVKEVEEKVTKLESKIDKIVDLFQATTASTNKSILDPDIVKALAPVVVTWLDSKGSKEASNTGQFSEMNKQIVGLVQGMQELVRISDKSKEDITEKERKEREQSRREVMDYQGQMEQRFLSQQQRAEERHQAMLTQMKESLENKHREALEGEQRMRLEYERLRQEFREKEERTREEARLREEKLREEARMRDEEVRRREIEFREKTRQDEERWREELRQREEAARRREIEWKEELRQKEIASLNEVKLRELEMMKQMRDMDQTKTNMQQKLIEQIYTSNNSNRESQLQMELAIAKMTSDNEARMLQSNAEMQLEKIRHATQMQMAKMKHDLTSIESKKSEDPIDSAMQEYLRRKLQIDMVKELNMDVDEGDVPNNNNLMNTLKKLGEGAGPILLQILTGGGLGQTRPPMMPNPGNVRPVNPTPNPVSVNTDDMDDEDFEPDDEEATSDEESDEAESPVEEASPEEAQPQEQPPAQTSGPDLSGINPVQEIPRVSAYFKYVKKSITEGKVKPAEVAAEARNQLSPLIVDFLSNVEDSRIVINQLYPLLQSMNTPTDDFSGFFVQEDVLAWLNEMLAELRKPQTEASKSEVEAKPRKKRQKADASNK